MSDFEEGAHHLLLHEQPLTPPLPAPALRSLPGGRSEEQGADQRVRPSTTPQRTDGKIHFTTHKMHKETAIDQLAYSRQLQIMNCSTFPLSAHNVSSLHLKLSIMTLFLLSVFNFLCSGGGGWVANVQIWYLGGLKSPASGCRYLKTHTFTTTGWGPSSYAPLYTVFKRGADHPSHKNVSLQAQYFEPVEERQTHIQTQILKVLLAFP